MGEARLQGCRAGLPLSVHMGSGRLMSALGSAAANDDDDDDDDDDGDHDNNDESDSNSDTRDINGVFRTAPWRKTSALWSMRPAPSASQTR